MNCPSCGAPLRLEEDKDHAICDYCKNLYFPEKNEEGVRVLGQESDQDCPTCGALLVHAAMSGMRFLYCTQCRGMLIPMPTFVELTTALRAQLGAQAELRGTPDPWDLERQIKCPRCHRRMDTHPYGGPGNVILDSCSKCFVNWLDHGELMRIAHAPDHTYRNAEERESFA